MLSPHETRIVQLQARRLNWTGQLVCTLTIAFSLANATPSLAEIDSDLYPNIVVIMADDMGFGDPGCNNSESKIETPNINRIANEGLRFTDAHSPASWCTPTRYGLLTGRYPFRTSLGWRHRPVIEENRLTLPAMLSAHGYRTAMVGKWHLGFTVEDLAEVHQGGPVDRGFSSWFGIPASLDIPPYYYIEGKRAVAPPTDSIGDMNTKGWSPIQGEFWRAGGLAPGFKHVDVLPTLTARAEKEILAHGKSNADKPLFLYLALPAPHTPWVPTKEFAGRSKVPLYGDFVMQVDATVGRVLAALDEAKMTEDTLVVFTSDNGPVWYEEDEVKYGHRATSIYRGMKGDAWEGGHRMPFVVRWPARINAGRVTNQLACHTDLFSTCASIVGHDLPEDAAEDSIDLSGVLTGEADESKRLRETLIVNSTGAFLTVRSGSWKLIPFRGSGGFSKPRVIRDVPRGEPKGQLYDLAADPAETKNLYDEHPEIVKELTTLTNESRKSGRTR
ncbi:MAG: arylsulfatase [Planctomycetes bacterium]|nr:arylsulfatase [Planctomycetota bacterium]